MEQKCRDVPDIRTPACMKAPEVPPLTVRTWSEICADPWVMRIVQWGYKILFVTLPPLRLQGQETTYPKGSLKWSSLNQSVAGLSGKYRGGIYRAFHTALSNTPPGNTGKYFLFQLFYNFSIFINLGTVSQHGCDYKFWIVCKLFLMRHNM